MGHRLFVDTVGLAVAITVSTSPAALSQPLPENQSSLNWVVGGSVEGAVRYGDTIYLGGGFRALAPSVNLSGAFLQLGPSALPSTAPALISGHVLALAPDGQGGWYIAGDFSHVMGGLEAADLAHIRADGTLDPVFKGGVDGFLRSIAVSPTAVYVGGEFSHARSPDGSELVRASLAAFDRVTGAVLPWNPVAGGPVHALELSGATLYVGGAFSTLGGLPRARIGVLDAGTGAVLAFNPSADDVVETLALDARGLHVGGSFSTIGAMPRARLARLDPIAGVALPWIAPADGTVYAIEPAGDRVFVGGAFAALGGVSRRGLGAVDATTGVTQSWQADVNGSVRALTADGPTLFLGGDFTTVGGTRRLFAAAAAVADAALSPWDPSLTDVVRAIGVSATTVAAGGSFNAFGAYARKHIAAFDLASGDLRPFHPALDAPITVMTLSGYRILCGGVFSSMDGQPRDKLAAIDARTGALLNWSPAAVGGNPTNMVTRGSTLYLGGYFTALDSHPRNGFGAIDIESGVVLDWNPSPNEEVLSLAAGPDAIYAGGLFTTIGGQSRPYLAALDPVTGAATSFAPVVDFEVFALALSPDSTRLYAAGGFIGINGVARRGFGAIRTSDGATEAWTPGPNDTGPGALAVSGDVLYAFGRFGTMGGQTRNRGAALSAGLDSGNLLPWNPSESPGDVRVVVPATDGVFVAGMAMAGAVDAMPSTRVAFYPIVRGGTPGAPSTTGALVRGDVVHIDWRPPLRGVRPVGYALSAGASPGGYGLAPGIGVGNALRFTSTGTPAGTYYVRAASAAGQPGKELGLVVGLGCAGPPQPPLEIQASVNLSDVGLSWSPPPGRGPFSYRLEALLDPEGSPIAKRPLTGTVFATPAPPGLYYVRIVTITACGTSAPSSLVTVPVGSVLPGQPDILTASVAASTVTLSWQPPASGGIVAGYILEAGTGPNLKNLGTLPVSSTSLTVSAPPGVYFVRVRAMGTAAPGPASNEVVVVVP